MAALDYNDPRYSLGPQPLPLSSIDASQLTGPNGTPPQPVALPVAAAPSPAPAPAPPPPARPMDVEARYNDAVRRGDTARAQQILRGEPPSQALPPMSVTPVTSAPRATKAPEISSAPPSNPEIAPPLDPGEGRRPDLTPPPAPKAAGQAVASRAPPSNQPAADATDYGPIPPLDPRPYEWFKKNDPVIAAAIDNAAEITGGGYEKAIRLAATKWIESDTGRTAKRGKANEWGVMQIIPTTWDMIDPQHRLHPDNLDDAFVLGGTLINKLDNKYGINTPRSVAAYNAGRPDPKARPYLQAMYGVKDVPEGWMRAGGGAQANASQGPTSTSALPGGVGREGADRGEVGRSELRPETEQGDGGGDAPAFARGFVDAASRGGPDGGFRFMVKAAPSELTLSDKWNHLEGMLIEGFGRMYGPDGVTKGRELAATLSHAGAIEHLNAAHAALSAGQGVVAAQHLAAMHAFVPDGVEGRFFTNGSGVHLKLVDERDPNHVLGEQPVTADGIAGLMAAIKNPQDYLENITKVRHVVAQTRHANAQAGYEEQRPTLEREKMANEAAIHLGNNQTSLAVAGINADRAEKLAGITDERARQLAADRDQRARDLADITDKRTREIEEARDKRARELADLADQKARDLAQIQDDRARQLAQQKAEDEAMAAALKNQRDAAAQKERIYWENWRHANPADKQGSDSGAARYYPPLIDGEATPEGLYDIGMEGQYFKILKKAAGLEDQMAYAGAHGILTKDLVLGSAKDDSAVGLYDKTGKLKIPLTPSIAAQLQSALIAPRQRQVQVPPVPGYSPNPALSPGAALPPP